ncbi:MAG: DNRLRE domain-containing protein [Planctomycetes bacterium]|nr:DNRLRE domain-containing protein [Planctomycetota bacterium]
MNKVSSSMIGLKGLSAAVLVGCAFVASAQAGVVDVPLNDSNSGDNFLYNNGANTNFANSGLFYYDARGAALDRARPIIRFNLASLPAGAVVTNAVLQLKLQQYTFINVNNGNATVAHNFSVYPMLTDWSETTSTWNERSAGNTWSTPGMAAGVDYGATAVDTLSVSALDQGNYLSWNITSLYNSWVSGASQNYGVHIHGPTGNPNLVTATGDTTDGVFRLYNTEYADDAFRPHLVVTYVVPSPASAAALCVGGLMLQRRRRTAAN